MFIPKRVIFEKGSLDTEIGQNIYNKVKDNPKISITFSEWMYGKV